MSDEPIELINPDCCRLIGDVLYVYKPIVLLGRALLPRSDRDEHGKRKPTCYRIDRASDADVAAEIDRLNRKESR